MFGIQCYRLVSNMLRPQFEFYFFSQLVFAHRNVAINLYWNKSENVYLYLRNPL